MEDAPRKFLPKFRNFISQSRLVMIKLLKYISISERLIKNLRIKSILSQQNLL